MGRRNLLLLTIDAWRADFVDGYFNVALTPNLSAHRGRTVRFDGLHSNGPWTTPGLLPMFTGEGPARHGVHWAWSQPRPDSRGLASVLAAAGFDVPNVCYLNQVGNYFHLGYDPATSPAYPKAPDDPVLFDALTAHAGKRAPFFGWYHYKFVHLPYWPAVAHREALGIRDAALAPRLLASVCKEFVVERARFPLDPVADAEPVRRLYAAGVRQMDVWLGRVFAHIQALDLWDDTTIVLTSDHGEELLERGHVGHASTAEHALLNEELLRIPLLVLDARMAAPGTAGMSYGADLRLEGRDLFPTLLGLAGVEAPAGHGGVDVSDLVLAPERFIAPPGFARRPFLLHSARMGYRTPKSHAAHALYGLTVGREKLIVERYETERASLYDLVADPGETTPALDLDQVARRVADLTAMWELAAGD